MYIALVLPHLSYCSSVWDPPTNSFLASELEKVQKFAFRMCSHNWSANYPELLFNFQLSSLSTRRSHSKLCLIYKILHKIIYLNFPPNCNIFNFTSPPIRSSRLYHPWNVLSPHCKTTATSNSFVPSVSSLWNSLPHMYYLKSSPSFKSSLKHIKLNT